ncbi:hypothetical protein IAR50_002441 [Cryptococcus sp. DSM 104548]
MPDDAIFAGLQDARSRQKARGRKSDPAVTSSPPTNNDAEHTKGTDVPSSLPALSKKPHPTLSLSIKSSTEFPSLAKAARSVPPACQEVHPGLMMTPQREGLAKLPLGNDGGISSARPEGDGSQIPVATKPKTTTPAKYHALNGTSSSTAQNDGSSRTQSSSVGRGGFPARRDDRTSWAVDDAIASITPSRPFPSSTTSTGLNRHQSSGSARGGRNGGGIRPRRTEWWRRDPHPMFSPKYAAQRLLIEFPLAISVAHAKAVLEKHFEKYGAVHSVYHYDQTGDRCCKGFVVFEDPVSIQRVFSDPTAKICDLTPDPETAESRVDITIRPSAASDLERIVFIRVTGSHSPEEARDRRQAHHKQYEIEHRDRYNGTGSHRYDSANSIKADGLALVHKELLPERVQLDQVPFRTRNSEHNRLFSSVCVRQISTSWEEFARQVKEACGKRPVNICGISVRHSSEHEFIPQLCDHLGEVCSLRQPSAKFPGWLVTVSGSREGRHMIHELQKIPGFFVRWADERDGLFSDDPTAKTLQWPNISINRPFPQDHSSPSPPDPAIHIPTILQNTLSSPSMPTILGSSPTHPTPRRALVHSSRGRTLVQDNSTGEARFLDECAVFVGRVNKDLESNESLQKRFEKYGRIMCLEFNPRGVAQHVNHATARVMYDNKKSAADAIAGENGAVSFGTHLRCELRKVIQSDVHTRAIYLDANNRPFSPTDVAKGFPDPHQGDPDPAIVDMQTEAPSLDPTPASRARQSTPISKRFATLSPLSAGYPLEGPVSPCFAEMGQDKKEGMESQMGILSLGLSGMASPSFDPSAILSFNSMWGLSQPNGVPALQPLYANGSNPISRVVRNPSPALKPSKLDEKDTPITTPASPSRDIPFATIAKPIEPSSHNLVPVGFKEENGTFTAIYADDELKSYCEKNGLPYPPERRVTPKKEEGHAKFGPAWKESLLPIQTGGHDPSISPLRRGSEAAISGEDRPLLTKLRLRRSRSDYSLDTKSRDGDVSETVSTFGSSKVPSPRGMLSNHHHARKSTPTEASIDDTATPGHQAPHAPGTPADIFQLPSLAMASPPPPIMPQHLIPIPIPFDPRASPVDELGRMGPPYISSHYPIYNSLSSSGSSGPAGFFMNSLNGQHGSNGYPSMTGYDVYAHQMAMQQQQHAMAMSYQYVKQPLNGYGQQSGGREGSAREIWGENGGRGNGGDVPWAGGDDLGNGVGNMKRNESLREKSNNYGSMRGKGRGGRKRGQLYQEQPGQQQQAQTEFADGGWGF